jgi:hypothetical protein
MRHWQALVVSLVLSLHQKRLLSLSQRKKLLRLKHLLSQ